MSAEALKQLRPLFNRVLVKKIEISKSKGGIVIPDDSGKTSRGVVVAVGPGSRGSQGEQIPCCVNVGDKVLLPDYGATRVEADDKQEYLIYREGDLLAKIAE